MKIKPAWTGLCDSDPHLYFDGVIPPAPTKIHPHPQPQETLPVAVGHELPGTVTKVGPGVTSLAVGDSDVVEPLMVFGKCPACRAGNYNTCNKMGFVGISGRGGSLSEYIVVEEHWVHPVGDLPLVEAALIEPLARWLSKECAE